MPVVVTAVAVAARASQNAVLVAPGETFNKVPQAAAGCGPPRASMWRKAGGPACLLAAMSPAATRRGVPVCGSWKMIFVSNRGDSYARRNHLGIRSWIWLPLTLAAEDAANPEGLEHVLVSFDLGW